MRVQTSLSLALLVVLAPRVSAQQPDGSPSGEKSVLDGVFTAAQAERGETAFQTNCAVCHSPLEFTSASFQRGWVGRTVGDMFDQVSATMPLDNPGSLTAQEYADVLSYLLDENGYPAGEQELPPNTEMLSRMRIELSDTAGAPSILATWEDVLSRKIDLISGRR